MADLNRKSIIFKIIGLMFSMICYGLSIGFHWDIGTVMMLFVVTIFAGFMIFCIALSIGIFVAEEAREDLVDLWVYYATCAYATVGVFTILVFNDTDNITIGLVAGIMSFVLFVITFLDCIFTSIE